MKLKAIERKTGSRSQVSRITFQKNGYIRLSTKAIEEYQVKEGMSVVIFQDEDKPNDFYVFFTDKQHDKWPVLRSDSKKGALLCGYTDAKLAIKKQFGLEVDRFNINLGGKVKTEFGTAICMITASLIKSKEVCNG